MTRQILIVGFGRAGKRHAKLLNSMGVTTGIFDIHPINYDDIDDIYGEYRPPIYDDFLEAVRDGIWNVAVIATPPSTHLHYIKGCLARDMWVSCEKPLCGFGQIAEAQRILWNPDLDTDKVQTQHNYRYNPDLLEPDRTLVSGNHAWQFVSYQYRH